jgi:hypothetical protein
LGTRANKLGGSDTYIIFRDKIKNLIKMKKNNWDIGLIYFVIFAVVSVLFGITIQVIYEILTHK